MSKRILALLCLVVSFFFISPLPVSAAENPLAVANNKIGIHILDTTELQDAAKLVNNNGGDWGYILIPIQSGDRDMVKWQHFMDDCEKYHLIPLVRLATEGDYFNTQVWRKPNYNDVTDFANFLDSLDWPTKNRYVIIFNEVNRGDEWAGHANASEYAQLLTFAVSVFKAKSPDFFIISAGMDNAAPNKDDTYINEYDYFRQMNTAVPGIFNQIDGISSHSYPNPGFSQPPDFNSATGVRSFSQERSLLQSLANNKNFPVFITETGWSADAVPEDKRVQYYDQTFKTIWNDSSIVAVTPFILQASTGPFQKFTFVNQNGSHTKQYDFLHDLAKTKGVPSFPTRVLGASTGPKTNSEQTKDFSDFKFGKRPFSLVNAMEDVFGYIINK